MTKRLSALVLFLFLSEQAFASTTSSVILNGSSDNTATGTTVQYHGLSQGTIGWFSTEPFAVVPTSGSFKNLYVETSTVGATESKTTTLRKGSSAGALSASALTCNVASGTTCNDTTHSVAVVAGDKVSVSVAGNAASLSEQYRSGLMFDATTQGETIILGGTSDTIATSGTEYNILQGSYPWGATEAGFKQEFPTGGTLKSFYAELSAALGVGATATLTVRVNGADTGLVLTFTGNSQVTANDTSNTVTISAADDVDVEWTVTAGTPGAAFVGWGLVFVPTVDGESVQMASYDANPSTSAANFSHGIGEGGFSGTASNRLFIYPSASIVLKKFYVQQTTAPDNGAGTDQYTWAVREEATARISVVISEASMAGNDTATTFTVTAAGDDGNIGVTPANTPATTGTSRTGFVTAITPASSIKTINGLAKASVKTKNGLAIASVKSVNGLQ